MRKMESPNVHDAGSWIQEHSYNLHIISISGRCWHSSDVALAAARVPSPHLIIYLGAEPVLIANVGGIPPWGFPHLTFSYYNLALGVSWSLLLSPSSYLLSTSSFISSTFSILFYDNCVFTEGHHVISVKMHNKWWKCSVSSPPPKKKNAALQCVYNLKSPFIPSWMIKLIKPSNLVKISQNIRTKCLETGDDGPSQTDILKKWHHQRKKKHFCIVSNTGLSLSTLTWLVKKWGKTHFGGAKILPITHFIGK